MRLLASRVFRESYPGILIYLSMLQVAHAAILAVAQSLVTAGRRRADMPSIGRRTSEAALLDLSLLDVATNNFPVSDSKLTNTWMCTLITLISAIVVPTVLYIKWMLEFKKQPDGAKHETAFCFFLANKRSAPLMKKVRIGLIVAVTGSFAYAVIQSEAIDVIIPEIYTSAILLFMSLLKLLQPFDACPTFAQFSEIASISSSGQKHLDDLSKGYPFLMKTSEFPYIGINNSTAMDTIKASAIKLSLGAAKGAHATDKVSPGPFPG